MNLHELAESIAREAQRLGLLADWAPPEILQARLRDLVLEQAVRAGAAEQVCDEVLERLAEYDQSEPRAEDRLAVDKAMARFHAKLTEVKTRRRSC